MKKMAWVVGSCLLVVGAACSSSGGDYWDGKTSEENFAGEPLIHPDKGPTEEAQKELDECGQGDLTYQKIYDELESQGLLNASDRVIVTKDGALSIDSEIIQPGNQGVWEVHCTQG